MTIKASSRLYSGDLNVFWFGAKGDGVTDDTAAIQATVNAIPSGAGGDILLPSAATPGGTAAIYKLNSNVLANGRLPRFKIGSGASLSGAGTLPFAKPIATEYGGIHKVISTTDANALNWVNNQSANSALAVEGNNNGYVSVVVNNLSPSTNSFPSAITAVAYQKGAGNSAYPFYAEAHINVAGVAATEFAAFQDGLPGPVTYPFNKAIGTTDSVGLALQLGAGTTKVAFTASTTSGSTTLSSVSGFVSPAAVGSIIEGAGIARNTRVTAIGAGTLTLSKAATATAVGVSLSAFNAVAGALDIAREGSTLGQFNYGMTILKGSALLYGFYIDASATLGAETGGYIGVPGDTGTNLVLQTAGAAVTANKMLDLQKSDGTSVAYITQGGALALSSTVSVLGSPVLGTRRTGWSVMTGTANRAAWDTATVTLAVLAQTVKALIDDTHSNAGHGLIGT